MLVSPTQVLSAYPTINRYHDSWSQTFARHAEVRLIDYLTSLKRRPSEIGMSKLCCRGCHVWISTVNDKIVQHGGVSVWSFRNPRKKLSLGKRFYKSTLGGRTKRVKGSI